jgi:hypothetical protein
MTVIIHPWPKPQHGGNHDLLYLIGENDRSLAGCDGVLA